MKRIIVLKGISNTGKTTKINQISDWIIRKYAIPNTIGLDITNFEKDTIGILKINNLLVGINTAGDDDECIKQIDAIAPNCDILICSCRTQGVTYQHIYKNYNRSSGWLETIIYVNKINPSNLASQAIRDLGIIDELQTWLIGLEK
jgi:hypothetical protein